MKKQVLMFSLSFPLLSLALMTCVQASTWDDVWLTQNQQAQQLMGSHQFAEAAKRFEDSPWRATAAYRAGQYDTAASGFQSLDTDEGYYNQGNALAHMGQYEKALKAYDHALRLNSKHEDAQFNRKVVEELIKKDKQKQSKENKDKQDQNKQNQDKQNQDKQNQDKQNQDKQNQDKQNQDKQNQDKQNQDKQNQDKQNQDKQNQDKQNQDKQNQGKQNKDKQNKNKQKANLSAAESEKQRAKEQWLRLIPDDPGGLMRQKFMRDHLRRQRGWDQ